MEGVKEQEFILNRLPQNPFLPLVHEEQKIQEPKRVLNFMTHLTYNYHGAFSEKTPIIAAPNLITNRICSLDRYCDVP